MGKPNINYKGFMQEDPSDRSKRICVPQIVDRNQTKNLADIVYGAIDRGLIAGLKPEAAQSIADGIMTQLGETLNNGTGVLFGEYFAVRPYLSGTIKNLLAPLTDDNKLRARFITGKAYDLNEKNFSFHNVTQSESIPKIASVQPNVTGAEENTFDPDQDLALIGENLTIGENDAVKLYNCDGETPVYLGDVDAAKITVNSAGLLAILSTGIAALSSVTKAGFVVAKTVVVDGTSIVVESVMATATKTHVAPAPSGNPPTVTGYVADDMEGEPISMDGSALVINGTDMADATKVKFSYSQDGEVFYEANLASTTDTTASVTCGYTETLTANNGYLWVDSPNGASNKVPCAFNA